MNAVLPSSSSCASLVVSDALNRECFCFSLDDAALARALDSELGQPGLSAMVRERCPYLFAARPVFVAAPQLRMMEQVVQAVESVVALPAYRQQVLGAAPAIARLGTVGPHGAFFGYDFHLNQGRLGLIEINTNAGGAMLNAVLARAQRACCAATDGMLPARDTVAVFEQRIVDMFRHEWQLAGRTRPLASIAIVDESPEAQYLYPEFLLFQQLFERHDPLIIAIDGQPVTPHAPPERQVVLAPGMRIDLVLDAVGDTGKRYAIGEVFYPRAAYDLLHLQYGDAALRERLLSTPVQLALNPLAEPDLKAATTHEIRFQGGMMGNLHGATLDGQPMSMMGLMRAGKAWAVNGVVAGGHSHEPALSLRLGQSYLLALVNDTRWHHPMHLHGHSFRVLRRNGRPTPHLEWQDTVLMAPNERVDVALVANNPGDWMLHCHILEHQDGGMMTIVRVA